MNKKRKTILVIGVLSLFAAQIAYSYNDKLTKDKLENELQGKNKEIILLKAEKKTPIPRLFQYTEFEEKLIQVVESSEKYKNDREWTDNNPPNDDFIKFSNSTFTTDGRYYYGYIGYGNVRKSSDPYKEYDDNPQPAFATLWNYVLKVSPNGNIEKLVVHHISDESEWVEAVYELPDSVMTDNMFSGYKYSLDQ